MLRTKSENLAARSFFSRIKSHDKSGDQKKSNGSKYPLNFVAIFALFGTSASFIDKICSSVTDANREGFSLSAWRCIVLAIHLRASQSEQMHRKHYSLVWYLLIPDIPPNSQILMLKTFG